MPLLLASEFPEIFEKAKRFFPSEGSVLIINTASIGEGFDLNYETEIKPFEDLGYTSELYDLADKSYDDVVAKVKQCSICYVAGGNTFYLLEHVLKSGFDKIVKDRLGDDDFLYIGSSAGSILMSPDIDFIAPMDEKEKANLETTQSIGFIPFAFLPHVEHQTMGDAALFIKDNYRSDIPLMCFRDDQAVYVDGNIIEII